LAAEGVQESKPEHFAQMQTYMHKKGLRWAVYIAVNKNDDDLHVEIVVYDQVFAEALLEKAGDVIERSSPGRRLHENPAMFDCKFCDFKGVCHFGAPMDKNCRTCVHSEPVVNGEWRCNLWNAVIPTKDAMLNGCPNHKQITD